jgi:hypothetical protein
MWRWAITVSLASLTAAVVVGIVLASGGNEKKTSGPLRGILTTTAPWPANTELMAQRLAELGLPGAGEALHTHSRLELYVHGLKVPVPAQIGISSDLTSPLHTHDASGVIHVESSKQQDFTLGEFFDIWGVRLTDSCLGAYCNGDEGSLRVFVSGKGFDGRIRNLRLQDETEIVVTFGKQSEMPEPIPSEFSYGS